MYFFPESESHTGYHALALRAVMSALERLNSAYLRLNYRGKPQVVPSYPQLEGGPQIQD